jgi:nucleotide-binding universal stress UspA family protein
MPIRVLMGYDGSPAANAALDVGAKLLPRARAWVAHLWTPPFANASLRQRLWRGAGQVDEFVAAIEREGEQEAEREAAHGVTLATAAGWDAEALVVRTYGGEGLRFTELAQKVDAHVIVVGSRGLGGARAFLGSVSDMVVPYTPRPVVVVPHPLLMADYAALDTGPVVVGFDGSAGARAAAASAAELFPMRSQLLVTVDDDDVPEDTITSPEAGSAGASRLRVPRGHGTPGRAVADALAGCARSHGGAMLVVGSRGRSAVRELVLGSVAMATLHHAYRPVMVVPAIGDG